MERVTRRELLGALGFACRELGAEEILEGGEVVLRPGGLDPLAEFP